MQPAPNLKAPPEPSAYDQLTGGKPYDARDTELVMLRQRARKFTREFNATPEDNHLARLRLLASLFGSVGEDAEIDAPLYVEYGRHLYVGTGFAAGPNCVLVDAGRITIGDNVRLGPGVHVYAVARPLKPEHRAAGYEQAAPVTIGDGAWIGGGTIINSGVSIGAGTTIGPGSVVLEDIPANVLASGNPCRVVREL